MDETVREKRRSSFLDIWTRKKQTFSPNDDIRRVGHNQRHKFIGGNQRQNPHHASTSKGSSPSSYSSQESDSESENSSSKASNLRNNPYYSHHRDRLEEYPSNQSMIPLQSLKREHDIGFHKFNYGNYEEYSVPRTKHLNNTHFTATQYDSSQSKKYSREYLCTLAPNKLRDMCLTLGLNHRLSHKVDLVEAIYHHFHSPSDSHYSNRFTTSLDDTPVFHTASTTLDQLEDTRDTITEDSNQMTLLLRELIPFYGQGDGKTDSVVQQTIAKLPQECLDMQDPSFGNTILMLCIQNGMLDLVPILLQKGCDPNKLNYDGSMALHFLCDPESLEVAEALLAYGAHVDIAEHKYGCTPLHWAASSGNIPLCKSLCDAGANPSTKDFNGYDSLAYARQSSQIPCLNYLIQVMQALSVNTSLLGSEDRDGDDHETRTNANTNDAKRFSRPVAADDRGLNPMDMSNTAATEPSFQRKEENLPVMGNQAVAFPSENVHRLHMHQGLENELLQHLLSIENKLNFKSDISHFEKEKDHISDMSDKLLQAQNELATNQREFKEVKLELVSLQEKYNSISSKSRPLVEVYDKCFGESFIYPDDECPEAVLERRPHHKDRKEDTLLEEENLSFKNSADGLSMLQQKVHELELENSRVMELQLNTESALIKKHDEMSAEIIFLHEAIKTKDTEIAANKRNISRLTLENESCRNTRHEDVKKEVENHSLNYSAIKEDEILALRRKIQELELDNGRLIEMKLNLESALIKKHEEIRSQSEHMCKMIKTKDIEISTLEQNIVRWTVDHASCKNDGSRETELEQLKLSFDQISEQLSRSLAEKESLRLSYEQNTAGLKSDLDSSSQVVRELQTKCNVNEKMICELEQTLACEHESKIKLSEDNLRLLNEVRDEKDVLINKWRREYVMLEDRHEVATRDLEICQKKNIESDVKLQEMSTLINEAKLALAANEKLHRMLQSEMDKRKKLHNQLEDMKGRIRVHVRIRPMSVDEIGKGFKCAVFKDDSRITLIRPDEPGNDPKHYEFDSVFGGSTDEGNNQVNVFKDTSQLITSVIDGYNVCIAAYGQTGSGKTYTMVGSGDWAVPVKRNGTFDGDTGLASRSSLELFRLLEEKEASHSFTVDVIVLELYMDCLKDLLTVTGKGQATETLRVKLAEHSESGLVEVDGATKLRVTSAAELLSMLKKGTASRSTASTQMNSDSSRSHLITVIEVALTHKKTGQVTRGKLTLVDLAGSERVAKSGATGIQLKEAQSINKSLSALGDVVNALTSGSKHIPYRNHPLTMLMSDSIGGNSKTLIFICCSPVDYNLSETFSSLDFAKRCKDVTNSLLNPANQLRQIKYLRSEIERLKQEKGHSTRRN